MKARSIKKDKRRVKGKIRALVFYSASGAIVIFAVFLFLLQRYSPLETVYHYLISFVATLLIVYPLAIRKVSSVFEELFKPLERDINFVESLIEGKYADSLNYESGEFLEELSEKLSVLGGILRDHVVSVKDSLFRLQDVADSREIDALKEEISSLLRNFEDSFKVD